MDEAFCARMRMAIEAGLESAPVGVITTPGTKNPKYVLAEPWSGSHPRWAQWTFSCVVPLLSRKVLPL